MPSRARFALLAVAVAALLGVSAHVASSAQVPSSRPSAPKTEPVPSVEDRIDINHASLDELLKIPGMTPSWAGRIVRFRPYRTKQDLLEHGVLPGEVYDRIKDYIVAHHDRQ